MPLFSDHISNMYYSGAPSYSALPSYSYSSSALSPSSGLSYSASYLNPGGNYSKHSSLGSYTRPAIPSRWTAGMGRNYSPILTTITERGLGSPTRIRSPRKLPLSQRSYATSYIPRPININTADIDVSRDRYTPKVTPPPPVPLQSDAMLEDDSIFMPRVDGKPETGIDSSPGPQRSTIKRGRTVVRLHTIRRKDKDSPHNAVEETITQPEPEPELEVIIDDSNVNVDTNNGGWREKLSDDLVYKDKREKKTLGAKMIEKFIVKDNSDSDDSLKRRKAQDSKQEKSPSLEPGPAPKAKSKSPDRRCSMEMLAEQANILDSLIKSENLSTALLDLSKIGTNNLATDGDNANLKVPSLKRNSLQSTKSDHSLHDRINSLRDSKDKQFSKRRSLKKSASGGSIRRLDSITEVPKEVPVITNLPVIDESGQLKEVKSKPKLRVKQKITSTVEDIPPASPFKIRVDNVEVEEKPAFIKKDIVFSSTIEDTSMTAPISEIGSRQSESRKSTRRKNKNPPMPSPSPEPEDGNFWDKIGKRETIHFIKRKEYIDENINKKRRAAFWFPEDEISETDQNIPESSQESSSKSIIDNKDVSIESEVDSTEKSKSESQTKAVKKDIVEIVPNKTELQENMNVSQLENINQPDEISVVDNNVCREEPTKRSTIDDKNTDKEEIEMNNDPNIKYDGTEKPKDIPIPTRKLGSVVIKETLENIAPFPENKKEITVSPILEISHSATVSLEEKVMPAAKVETKKEICETSSGDPVKDIPSEVECVINKLSENKNESTVTPISDVIQCGQVSDVQNAINKVPKNVAVNKNETTVTSSSDVAQQAQVSEAPKATKKTPKSLAESCKCQCQQSEKQISPKKVKPESPKKVPKTKTVPKAVPEPVAIMTPPDEVPNVSEQPTVNIPCEMTQEPGPSKLEDTETVSEETKAETDLVPEPKVVKRKKKTRDYGLMVPVSPNKPAKDEAAIRPLIATPRPLQKKTPQIIHSSSSSESSSEEDSSSDEEADESDSSEECQEFFECESHPDGRTSTGSNDSGFDSSAPTSPAGFVHIKKDCDVNCHRKCEKLTANLCGVNQRLLVEALASRNDSKRGAEASATTAPAHGLKAADIIEQELEASTAYEIYRKTGRFTPPARTIPRFRKYNIEDFHFIKVLGKGSFGKVLLAELRDTEYYYAVKCLKKDVVLEDDDVECTLIERKVLALGTNHPYLCHLFATFQTDSHLFFVMEYLNGGDLMFHIQQSGRFPENRARFYASEIVSGLKFLHKRGIVYRDLKLDNILLDYEGHVRIADFGMCKLQIFLDKTADTFCGTPDYMAPEIIKGQKYNQTVDWWSFGVLLYEMLIGQSPFSGCDEDELFWSICNETPNYPRFLSQQAHSILTRLLDKDAHTRLGGMECMHGDVRDQDFFSSVSWDKLERRDLDAPFRPKVRHPLDTQYFDRAFTGERPRLTTVEPQVLRTMDQTPFRGFSYTNPNATDR